MMTLDDYRPSSAELADLERAGVADCEQVAIGFLRAQRKDRQANRFAYLRNHPKGFA